MLQITNEDCMDLMARYPDGYFELAIVDPPYGIAEKMKNGSDNIDLSNRKTPIKRGKKGKLNAVNEMRKWDICPSDDYFIQLKRVSKNQIIWGANYMPSVIKILGVNRCALIWDKQVSENFTLSQFEFAYTSFNQLSKIFKYAHSNAVGFAPGLKGIEKIGLGIHPTQKPVALYKWLLHNYAKPGDKILDTHLGSGSIAIACHDYGFDLTACELDKEYFEAAMKRIDQYTAQTKLF